jgi:hypothetical protein
MAKKDFKSNPALQFISTPAAEEEPVPQKTPIPTGYKMNPAYIETKSKRVQLLVQPSIIDAVARIADRKGISRNEAINEALKQYAEREG